MPVTPGRFVLADEARRARRRLYPSTVLYSAYFLVVAGLAWGPDHRTVVVAAGAAGVCAWTVIEYLAHRYILHGRFPDGPGLRRLAHRHLDHLHVEHHSRPWDGNHISGTLRDTLVPWLFLAVLSFAAGPVHTWPLFVAAIILSYVAEEWVHHSVHYCRFNSAYFRYIRRHHLFHHSPRGSEVAYGLTSGLWDAVLGTRIPALDRARLYRQS